MTMRFVPVYLLALLVCVLWLQPNYQHLHWPAWAAGCLVGWWIVADAAAAWSPGRDHVGDAPLERRLTMAGIANRWDALDAYLATLHTLKVGHGTEMQVLLAELANEALLAKRHEALNLTLYHDAMRLLAALEAALADEEPDDA
jgi:hypothetical protein